MPATSAGDRRRVEGKAPPGTIYELGGPEVLTFRQCMERMLEVDRQAAAPAAALAGRATLGRIGQYLPGKPLTVDQVRMLQLDNVVSEAATGESRTLAGLGIEPTSLEAIAADLSRPLPRARPVHAAPHRLRRRLSSAGRQPAPK